MKEKEGEAHRQAGRRDRPERGANGDNVQSGPSKKFLPNCNLEALASLKIIFLTFHIPETFLILRRAKGLHLVVWGVACGMEVGGRDAARSGPVLCPAHLSMEGSGRQEAPTAPAPSPTPASPGGPPNALLLKGPDGQSRVLFIFPLGSLGCSVAV